MRPKSTYHSKYFVMLPELPGMKFIDNSGTNSYTYFKKDIAFHPKPFIFVNELHFS
jgi:hypothetical protein